MMGVHTRIEYSNGNVQRSILAVILCSCLLIAHCVSAASFPGTACVEVQDPSGGLSWVPANNALTVECWFRMSVPSGQTISENMTILVNSTNQESTTYAYLLQYNAYSGDVEFQTRSGSTSNVVQLISRPYLDRWYHVAIRRNSSQLWALVDGREVAANVPLAVGAGATNAAVSIGGWGSGKSFWGDIQELRIYQQDVSSSVISARMFQDLVAASYPTLRGYYKLAYSTNSTDYLKNYSAYSPTNTSPGLRKGAGSISFEEVDQAGEQSLFDSRKNGGESAIVPLSGAYALQQTLLARSTPGIPMAFRIGYSSANAYTAAKLGDLDPLEDKPLGRGWRHAFQMRLLFKSISAERHLVNWDGSVEAWVKSNNVYSTRHREYRGELTSMPSGDFEWVTPERVRYRFIDPTSGDEIMQGRLYEICDPNSNVVSLAYNPDGVVTQVVDTVGGSYDLQHNLQGRLTNIQFQGWSAALEYTNDLLSAWTLIGPPGYTSVNTRWEFQYTNNLLWRVKDPNGVYRTEVTYDTYGRKIAVKDALNRSTTIEYDKPTRRQMRSTDPGSKQWVDSFDRKGRLLTRADPFGNSISFVYDKRGNMISKTEPLGWRTTFAYDDRSNLIAETNALGLARRWIIHANYNKPIEAIDTLNWSTYFTYDTAGNLVTNYDGLGVLARNTYYSNGLAETATDGNGNTTHFEYTPDGFLSAKTDPASNTWHYSYNELGWQCAVTNPLDQVSSFAYDLCGRQVRVTDPLRAFTKTYDANGNTLAESDAKDALTHYAYDAANQRTQMVDRASNTWSYTYTTRGSLWTSRDPLGATFTRAYDDANRLISVTDPLNNVETMEYNANGSAVATVDKLGRRFTKTFDRLNRVIAETDPLGNTKTTTFDAAGRVKTVTTPNGYISTHEYDGRGRLIRWLDAEGFEWGYAYDGLANITNITDALSGHYVMAYGPRNERIMEKNQDGFEWHYVYDELLRLKQQTDPNGVTRNIEYDVVGRIDYVWFSTGRTDNYSYNDTSDNISGLDRSSPMPPTSCSFVYDSMDRVSEYTDPFSKKVKYGYDSAGRFVSVTYPDSKIVTNRYDLLGRLTNQTDWASREINYAWDKANRLVTRKYPNGITQTNAYDSAGRLTTLSYLRASGNPLIALEYAFDRNGNKTSHLEQGTLNWALPTRIDECATYTPFGQLLARSDTLNSTNSFTYAYDSAGNMTNAVSVSQNYALTYDEDNRILSVAWRTNGVTRTIQNRFDALGRRVSKKDNGVETRYVLDLSSRMERILCDLNASSQITAWYVHGPDLSYRVDTGGNLSVYLADAQANIIAVADANTNLVTTYAYTPYGRLLGVSGSQNDPYRFVGSQGVMQDLPELYFMRARYYSANAALFLSVDPVRGIGPGLRLSSYQYGHANPETYLDVNGMTAEDAKYCYFAKRQLWVGEKGVPGASVVQAALNSNPLVRLTVGNMDSQNVELYHAQAICEDANGNEVFNIGFTGSPRCTENSCDDWGRMGLVSLTANSDNPWIRTSKNYDAKEFLDAAKQSDPGEYSLAGLPLLMPGLGLLFPGKNNCQDWQSKVESKLGNNILDARVLAAATIANLLNRGANSGAPSNNKSSSGGGGYVAPSDRNTQKFFERMGYQGTCTPNGYKYTRPSQARFFR